jgi:hypothetical protein
LEKFGVKMIPMIPALYKGASVFQNRQRTVWAHFLPWGIEPVPKPGWF